MMAATERWNGLIVINDSTPVDVHSPDWAGRGLEMAPRARAADADGFAYGGLALPFPKELLIPVSEMPARIKEREERKTTNRDQIRRVKLKGKDQKQTNFCWANGPVQALEFRRAYQNQEYVELSSASVACKINGFRNQGGWGRDAVEFITNHGCMPASIWPNAVITRAYDTDQNWAIASRYKMDTWIEVQPRNMQQLFSLLLMDEACVIAVGYNWWGHEVLAVDPIVKDGVLALLIRNQWYPDGHTPWGDDNFGVLEGSRMYADDAVAPVSALAS